MFRQIGAGSKDHPRVCGEKLSGCVWLRVYGGSPPRMRGKVNRYPVQIPVNGITPAYAGKRTTGKESKKRTRDHPRVCGEKSRSGLNLPRSWGSPPRMRGKDRPESHRPQTAGITPAYAGKRLMFRQIGAGSKDHPRVCGEKLSGCVWLRVYGGSPPRMRGKVNRYPVQIPVNGITPAYAGKSLQRLVRPCSSKDHPRVCGEKPMRIVWEHAKEGSPPRMRGKAAFRTESWNDAGITPAYAGKRKGGWNVGTVAEDHPRVCGEKPSSA